MFLILGSDRTRRVRIGIASRRRAYRRDETHMTALGVILLLLGVMLVVAEAHVPGGILGASGGLALVGGAGGLGRGAGPGGVGGAAASARRSWCRSPRALP